MVISSEDKSLIKGLKKLKEYSSTRFLRKFPTNNWTKGGLDYLLVKIDCRESVDCVVGSGCLRTACTFENITIVKDTVLSQKDAPHTHCVNVSTLVYVPAGHIMSTNCNNFHRCILYI